MKTLKAVIKIGDKVKCDPAIFGSPFYQDVGAGPYEVTKINRVTFEAKNATTGRVHKFDKLDAQHMLRATGRIYETIFLN